MLKTLILIHWLKKNNLEYYGTVPSTKLFDQSNLEISGVWNKCDVHYPYFPIRLYKQLSWILTNQREGGYWITLGRLKN
mgnify:CR=1 FL=1